MNPQVTTMRTTLTIDDDLAGLLKQRAREMGVPFKEVVNRTIRAGLGEAATTRRSAPPKTMPHSFGFKAGIDLDKLGQLRPGDRLRFTFVTAKEAQAAADERAKRLNEWRVRIEARKTPIPPCTIRRETGGMAVSPARKVSGWHGRPYSASSALRPIVESLPDRWRWMK